MAIALTSDQLALLRSPDLAINTLADFYLDSGTYHFCDNTADLSDGTTTWIGAQALTDSVEIRSPAPLASEQVTLTIDGNRMAQYGVSDPAGVLVSMLAELHVQRRVDLKLGLRYNNSATIQMVLPTLGTKINYCRLVDDTIQMTPDNSNPEVTAKLEIVLDTLSARYSETTDRTRSNEDQLEIDATDMFFSFASEISPLNQTIYWGKDSPITSNFSGEIARIFGIKPKSTVAFTGN